jgi:hypothetical protein
MADSASAVQRELRFPTQLVRRTGSTRARPTLLDVMTAARHPARAALEAQATVVQADTFSLLASVSGDVAIHNNDEMLAVNLPKLVTVTGSLTITQQRDTEAITLPELASVGQNSAGDSVKVDALRGLILVSAPKLGSVPENIAMNRCGNEPRPTQSPLTLAFTSLKSIGGSFDLNELPGLTKLDGFPLLASVAGSAPLDGAVDSIGLRALLAGDGRRDHRDGRQSRLDEADVDDALQRVRYLAYAVSGADGDPSPGAHRGRSYVDPLVRAFGYRLFFPPDFVGRGDMSRGGLMLRAASSGEELTYALVEGTTLHGPRPARFTPRARA